ncbi:pseudouridine synthase [soil metagenome]
MSTIKLKKPANAGAPGDSRRDPLKPARAPVRLANAERIRPTQQQMQRDRAERDERFRKDAEARRRGPGGPSDQRGPHGQADHKRDGSKPMRRAPEAAQGGFRDSRSEPRFESRPAPRRDDRPAQRPEPDFASRQAPRTARQGGQHDSRSDPRRDQRNEGRSDPRSGPRSNAPGDFRGNDQRDSRGGGPSQGDPRGRPRQDSRDAPRSAFGNERRDAPYGNDRGPASGSRNDRPDGRGPSQSWVPRKEYVPRGNAPVGGRDRRPDLRQPRNDPRVSARHDRDDRRDDPRNDNRPDVRPALPPEPELRSEAEHAAFPNRPTGSRPEHVQGTKTALEGVRLSKRMSELGMASRREADEWIQRGWVRVDGVVVSTLGSRVTEDQKVELDEQATGQQAQRVTVLLHKPAGYVSGQAEDGHQPASVLCTPDHRSELDTSGIAYSRDHVRGIPPAGRLDMDSTGLLVYTQDGRIAKQLIGGDANIEKEYFVRVENENGEGKATGLSDEQLALLNHGIELEGVPLRPAEVSWTDDQELRFVLREGKKRQIRRMCEAVGLQVLELRRVRIGNIVLGDLAEGEWRYLGADESFV